MKSTIKKILPDALTIATERGHQRAEGVDQVRVNKMAANFEPNLLGVLTASQRADGRIVVLDGAHRLSAARAAGHTAALAVEVFTDALNGDEAGLFLGRNDGRMPSALSKFHARVASGDPIAVAIDRIATEHQWTVTHRNEPASLGAIDAFERVYRNGGGTLPEGAHPELASRVLELITIAWEWDRQSVQASMLLAVAQLLGRFGPSIDTKKLVNEMQGTRPTVLIGRAKTLCDVQGGAVPAALARILVGMHNNKRRTNLLPEWVWIR